VNSKITSIPKGGSGRRIEERRGGGGHRARLWVSSEPEEFHCLMYHSEKATTKGGRSKVGRLKDRNH